MSLSMEVGFLAYLRKEDPEGYEWKLRRFQDINRLLQVKGFPAHEEPVELPRLERRCRYRGQPYGWLHYLRRALAYALEGHKKLPAFSPDDEPTEDPIYDSVLCDSESHVICHSDCEGFYVPVDFPEPLYDPLSSKAKHCVVGGILGSSQGAMRELIQVAPLLGIRLTREKVSQKVADELNEPDQEETPLWIARQAWFLFFESARVSIEHKTAIVFT